MGADKAGTSTTAPPENGVELLALAPKVPVDTTAETFALADANQALTRLREGKLSAAAVLLPA
jgi:propanol-preferring alcohol dehydrogenase